MIVVDVNLVAYLLLDQERATIVQGVFQEDPLWAAPLLWRSEFRNVLAAYIRQRDLGVEDALRAHELAESLFGGREYLVSGERVLALVAASRCSAYDCEYVALAEQLEVPLITADRQLLKSFAGRAISPGEFVAAAG